MSDVASFVRASIQHGIGWIEFCRAPVNAINWQMLNAIHDAIAAILGDPLARAAALAAIRRTITMGGGLAFKDGLAMERDTAIALADTPDFAEGIAAFLQKRRPQWSKG